MEFPLITDRLHIRPFGEGDFSKYVEGIINTEERKNEFDQFSSLKSRITHLTEEQFQQSLISDHSVSLQLFNKEETLWLGTVDIYNIKHGGFQSANIDYILLNQFWKKGFAREALTAIIPFAFEQLGLHRLEATIEPHNHKSLTFISQFDFECEGVRRHGVKLQDTWKDLKVFSLLNLNNN